MKANGIAQPCLVPVLPQAPGHLVPPAAPTAPRNPPQDSPPRRHPSTAGGWTPGSGPAKPPAAAAHRSRCPLAASSGFGEKRQPGRLPRPPGEDAGAAGQGQPSRRSTPSAIPIPSSAGPRYPPSGRPAALGAAAAARGRLPPPLPTAVPRGIPPIAGAVGRRRRRGPHKGGRPPSFLLRACEPSRYPHLWDWRGLLDHLENGIATQKRKLWGMFCSLKLYGCLKKRKASNRFWGFLLAVFSFVFSKGVRNF